MHIVFVGGGSLGPVTPLLAVAQALKRQTSRSLVCSWIGTPDGPERALVEAEGMKFFPLAVAKWPRYPSISWATFPWQWVRARKTAKQLVQMLKPDAVITVGGFTAVPVIQAAAADHILCFAHQLDVEPGLTNRLIARHCVSVTTSFEYEKRPFGERVNDEPLITPMRYAHAALSAREMAAQAFGLDPHQSIVCIYGGGQGAHTLNLFVERTLDTWLRFTQIIHLTGQGKDVHLQHRQRKGYVVRPLLTGEEMRQAHAAADLEITRAGIGTLSEIAGLKKAAFIIPIPDTHQEANARAFEERGAAIVFDQASSSFDEDVVSSAKLLLHDRSERQAMGERANTFFPTDDGTAFAKRILHHLASRV